MNFISAIVFLLNGHGIKARPPALRGMAAAKRLPQDRTEQLKINRRAKLLKRIAYR
jgi:hypothetical protein